MKKYSKKATQRLIFAVYTDNLEKVKQALLDGADPKDDDSWALRSAVIYDHLECVKLLIPVSDAKAMDSWALRYAVNNCYVDYVKLLIPVSDPKVVQELKLETERLGIVNLNPEQTNKRKTKIPKYKKTLEQMYPNIWRKHISNEKKIEYSITELLVEYSFLKIRHGEYLNYLNKSIEDLNKPTFLKKIWNKNSKVFSCVVRYITDCFNFLPF